MESCRRIKVVRVRSKILLCWRFGYGFTKISTFCLSALEPCYAAILTAHIEILQPKEALQTPPLCSQQTNRTTYLFQGLHPFMYSRNPPT